MYRIVSSIVLVLSIYSLAVSAQSGSQCSTAPADGRLYRSVIPTAYHIALSLPDPNTADVNTNGTVTVNITVTAPVDCIVLHADPSFITVQSAELNDGVALKPSPLSDQFLALLSGGIPSGSYSVTLKFTGKVNTPASQSGLFKSPNVIDPSAVMGYTPEMVQRALQQKLAGSSRRQRTPHGTYQDIDAEDHHAAPFGSAPRAAAFQPQFSAEEINRRSAGVEQMLATQFESSSARMAFPCFDEPGFKAYFTATLDVPAEQNLTVLYNTPLESTRVSAGREYFQFASTKTPLSSYLNAIGVGRFDKMEATGPMGVVYRVFTPPGYGAWATFSLNVTQGIINYWSKLWKFDYTRMNSKLDQIPVPAFLDAMENQGLCTYYTPWLLVDPTSGTLEEKQAAAEVVIHELSHQWFGDTVTCPWWDQIYLQEGFARYFQYTGAEALFPSWDLWTNNASTPVLGMLSWFDWPFVQALDIDVTGLAAAVVQKGEQESYRPVYYPKGAAINRGLNIYIGDEAFNTALSTELNKHPFSNPDVNDLIASFQAAGVTPATTDNLKAWLYQKGMPIVEVQMTSATEVMAKQYPSSPFINQNDLWWINMDCYAFTGTSSKEAFHFDFNTATSTVSLSNAATSIRCNANTDGREYETYVILRYSSDQWPQVFTHLSQTKRAYRKVGVHNIFNLVKMSWEPVSLALNVTSVLATVYTQPSTVANYVSDVQDLLALWHPWVVISGGRSFASQVNTGLGIFVQGMLDAIGLTSDPDTFGKVRATLLNAAVQTGTSKYIDELQVYWTDGSWSQPGNEALRTAVLYSVSAYPTPQNFAALKQIWETNPSTDVQNDALFALTAFNVDVATCQQILAFNYSGPSDQIAMASNMMAYSPKCRQEAWTYFQTAARAYWDTSGAAATPFILGGFDNLFSEESYLTDAKALLQEYSQYIRAVTTDAVLKKIQININFVKANEQGLFAVGKGRVETTRFVSRRQAYRQRQQSIERK